MDEISLTAAKDARAIAEARLATIRADIERDALESMSSAKLLESQPRLATGNPYTDDYIGNYGESQVATQQWARVGFTTALDDRENQRYRPFYLDEHDLRRKRAEWRNLAAFSATAIGANESRKNYVLGEGLSFESSAGTNSV